MLAGSIVSIRGTLLKHFVAPWEGYRYSVVHFFKESLHQRPPEKKRTAANINTEDKNMWAGTRLNPKESIFDLLERTKWKQYIQNCCRTHVWEIRKMVAYDHVKPEDWYTAQE